MKRLARFLPCLVIGLILNSQGAFGFKCKIDRGSFFENIDSASLILLGNVAAIKEKKGDNFTHVAKVNAKEIFKSSKEDKLLKEIDIFYTQVNTSGCKMLEDQLFLKEKETYLFYLRKEDGRYLAAEKFGGAILKAGSDRLRIPQIIKRYVEGEKKDVLTKELPSSMRP